MNAREFLGRLQAMRRRRALDRELEADLATHVEMLARDFEHEGMSPREALAAARRQVGNLTALREQSRAYWGFPIVQTVMSGLRYALRGLRRSPGFTIALVVTLGLGIGANVAMFSVVDQLMFAPFPGLRDPHRVHRVYLQTTFEGRRTFTTSFPFLRYRDLQSASGAIESIAAQSEWRFGVGTGAALRVRAVAGVSGNYFSLFDAPPVQGRYFDAAEDSLPFGTRVAVISHALWESDFGSANAIGKHLKVGMLDYTIVGVAPRSFVGTSTGGRPDVFVPITTIPANLGSWTEKIWLTDYSWDWTEVLVKRRAGASAEQASTDLTGAYIRSRARARAINPRVRADSLAKPVALAGPVKDAAGPDAGLESRVLLWVTGVAAIVLLIACANVANLLFARVLRRRRETTVRLALGASRARLFAQFATESLLLAALGGTTGLLAASWATAGIRALLLPNIEGYSLLGDWRALLVAFACTLLAISLTAVGPALLATRTDIAGMLKSSARGNSMYKSGSRTALLVLQSALSALLLVGAGLFVRSLGRVQSQPLGYDVRPVLEVISDFRGFEMDSAADVAMQQRLLLAAQRIPGVESVARANSRLFGTNTTSLRIDGIDSVEALGRFNFQLSTPDYFRVMRTRIVRGRPFTDSDHGGAPRVAVVSESMARAVWPGRDAIGQCMHVTFGRAVAPSSACTTVIGIAENAAHQAVTEDPRFMYYLPAAQFEPRLHGALLLRMSVTDAGSQLERVRREMNRAMPGDGFVVVRPLQDIVDRQTRSWRLGATLFTAFGVLALIVAIVGLYGVVSYTVAQRMHEVGVRIALGARSADVVRLFVWQGMRVAIIGVTIGLSLALVASRWLQPLLFQQSARDPLTYGAVAAAMLLASVAASGIPAMRAARADPNSALRSD